MRISTAGNINYAVNCRTAGNINYAVNCRTAGNINYAVDCGTAGNINYTVDCGTAGNINYTVDCRTAGNINYTVDELLLDTSTVSSHKHHCRLSRVLSHHIHTTVASHEYCLVTYTPLPIVTY